MNKFGSFSVITVLALSAACERTPLHESLIGLKTQTVEIEKKGKFSPAGQSYPSNGLELLGEDSGVCISILDPKPRAPDAPERALECLRGASLSGHMKLADGQRVDFKEFDKNWSDVGIEAGPDTLSICLKPDPSWKFSGMQEVSEIGVYASQPIDVQSVYWSSSNIEELFQKTP